MDEESEMANEMEHQIAEIQTDRQLTVETEDHLFTQGEENHELSRLEFMRQNTEEERLEALRIIDTQVHSRIESASLLHGTRSLIQSASLMKETKSLVESKSQLQGTRILNESASFHHGT